MAFGDASTVMADRAKQSWKLTTATLYLNPEHTVAVPYASVYEWPNPDTSGIGSSGYPLSGDKVTFYREGEAYPPKADDQVEVNGSTYLITKVTSRLNRDELTMGYAVYDCNVSRLTNE